VDVADCGRLGLGPGLKSGHGGRNRPQMAILVHTFEATLADVEIATSGTSVDGKRAPEAAQPPVPPELTPGVAGGRTSGASPGLGDHLGAGVLRANSAPACDVTTTSG
jgi:hypothetical protein